MPERPTGPGEAEGGAARLGLGTAQFGLDYGVTNLRGRVPGAEIGRILDHAREVGTGFVDTAALYGGSEEALGDLLPSGVFAIVTKTPKFGDCGSSEEAANRLEASFARSLRLLRATSVDGLLVHDGRDLLGPFGDALWQALARLKAQGRAARIGASVYDGHEIDIILERYEPDIVQLPTNAIDVRLLEGGQLEKLAGKGVEVHARSIFLQGLLLQRSDDLDERFAAIRPALAGLHQQFAAAGFSTMEGLLAAVLSRPGIERVVVGCTSRDEFAEIAAAADAVAGRRFELDVAPFAVNDPRLLNPALWSAS
jgi:aryl-alcohol dehydrogenase-like predicted oxidoreductase